MADSRGFTDSLDNQKNQFNKYSDTDTGPYVGVVKYTQDPLKMGRLGVNIPALTNTSEPSASQIVWCQYLSPFYGAKSPRAISKSDPSDYKLTQHSYGFWAIPPDIDTEVLVIFAKAETAARNAFWIGCIQQPLTNQMVPGYGASTFTELEKGRSTGREQAIAAAATGERQNYGADLLPVGEKNSFLRDTSSNPDIFRFPVNDILAEQLLAEGLIQDNVRGTTTSSARRETPSRVFGMSTPGRIRADSRQLRIGLDGSAIAPDRNPGHSFVMDDGDNLGNNQLTRLRTASGHQILMHDTDGSIYIANGSGNAWIEMQSNGRIDVYSGVGGINMRTEGDFNLHSDSNVNIHANGQMRISSANEMIHSADAILNLGDKGILSSSQSGSVREYARDGISSFTKGTQLHGASGQVHLAGAQVHFNSTNASSTWGPLWLTKEAAGMQLREEGDVELTHKGLKPLESFTRKTKTTVHRFVTHEPMFRASVIGNDGIIPIDSDDKKQWSKLANTPGTAEFLNMQNRISTNSAIRDAQYQADALEYVKQKMGKSTNVVKAKELLQDFGNKYNDIYGISKKANLPFDIKDSISEKLKGIDFNTSKKDLTNTLTSQVVESFTNKSKELFKDNVFVNSAGELFTVGNNTLQGITGGVDVLNKSLNTLDGLKGNLSSIRNIESTVSNLNSITQTYSSIVGGKVVGLNQVKKLASKTGLFNAREAGIAGQSFLANVGANLSTKIGAIAGVAKTFFSGFKFSDVRLKEEIRLVGKSPMGINIYSFKYKQLPGRYIGVMAQEVPWARHKTDTGYYAVDYSKVDVTFRRLN